MLNIQQDELSVRILNKVLRKLVLGIPTTPEELDWTEKKNISKKVGHY